MKKKFFGAYFKNKQKEFYKKKIKIFNFMFI